MQPARSHLASLATLIRVHRSGRVMRIVGERTFSSADVSRRPRQTEQQRNGFPFFAVDALVLSRYAPNQWTLNDGYRSRNFQRQVATFRSVC